MIELDFILSLLVFFCYLIVMKLYHFQRVVILLHCDGLSETRKLSKKKIKIGSYVWFLFVHPPFVPLDKYNLR